MTIHTDIPHERYHAYAAISKSGLDQVSRSIRHYLNYLQTDYDTVAMKRGRAIHQLLLEGGDAFLDTFAITHEFKDWRTKAARQWRDEQFNDGRIPTLRKEAAEWRTIALAVKAHPRAAAILERATFKECSIFWRDEEYDVDCRCRPDILILDEDPTHTILVDIKTTNDAGSKQFAKSVANYRYDVQWEFYGRGISTVNQDVFPQTFIIIAVETKPPFEVAVYELEPEWRLRAHDLLSADLRRYSDYIHSDKSKTQWWGYPHEIQTLSMPRWA